MSSNEDEQQALRTFTAKYRWVLRLELAPLRQDKDLGEGFLDEEDHMEAACELLAAVVMQEAVKRNCDTADRIGGLAKHLLSTVTEQLVEWKKQNDWEASGEAGRGGEAEGGEHAAG